MEFLEFFDLSTIIASVGGVGGFIIFWMLIKKTIKKLTIFFDVTYTFFKEYREKIRAVFDTDQALKDYKAWLKSLDEATEAIANLCNKLKFIPKRFILKLRSLIKENQYKNE